MTVAFYQALGATAVLYVLYLAVHGVWRRVRKAP